MRYKNKKGIAYIVLTTPFIILLFIYAQVTIFTYDDISEDLEFGNYLEETSRLIAKTHAQDFYVQELISDLPENFKEIYLISGIDLQCFNNNEIYFFDESKDISCLPNLPEDQNEYSITYANGLQTENQKISSLLQTESLEFLAEQDKENPGFISYSSKISTPPYSSVELSLSSTKEVEINLNQEYQLFLSLKNNIVKLPDRFNGLGSNCVIAQGDKEKCLLDIAKETLEEGINDYEIVSSYSTQGDYFILNHKVREKETLTEIISFNTKHENSMPFQNVEFSVSPFEDQDNIVQLTLKEPIEPGKNLHGFIVLYAYENFFDQSYQGYNGLISLLSQKGRIPQEFTDQAFPFSSSDTIKLMRSSEDLGFDLNLMFIPKSPFVKTNYSYEITQAYDYNSNQYELLETGKTLYVYVFAVDKSFKYYVDEENFKQGIKNTQIQEVIAPKPLLSNNVDSTKTISGLNNAAVISLLNYEDPKFSYYSLHLCTSKKRNNEDFSSCSNIGNLRDNTNQNFIVYGTNSNTSVLQSLTTYNLISAGINFEASKSYYLYVIPRNNQNLGIEKQEVIPYEYSRKTNQKHYLFYASKSQTQTLKPYGIEINP